MKKIFAIPMHIKKRSDFIIAVILLFLLLSPQSLWYEIGEFNIDRLIFAGIALLLILVGISKIAEGKRNFLNWLCKNVWFVLYIATLLIAVVMSTNRQLSLQYLARYLSGPFIVCIIYLGEFTYKKIRRIFGFAALGILVLATYAVIQRIQGIAPSKSFTDLTVNPNMPGRVVSFFDNPNVLGFALVALLPMLLAYVFINRWRPRAAFGAVSFIVGTGALIMTYSRGPWFSFAIGMFVFVALCKPKLIPVFLVVGLIAFPFIPLNIKDRALSAFNPNDQSIGYRSLLVGSGLELIKARPIFGAGLGQYTVSDIVLANYWPSHLAYRFPHTHNLFVQIWCEMGMFGFITFFGMVIHNIIRAVRNFRNQSQSVRILISSLVSGILAMIMCGIVDYTLSYSRIMLLFWILFGLLASAQEIEEGNDEISVAREGESLIICER